MIDIASAEKIVKEKIKEIGVISNIELAIMKDETITFEFGWMFFYQSKKFIETHDMGEMLGGNAPIIVDKLNSSLHITGTRMDEEYYIEKYCKYRDNIDLFYNEIS